MDPCKTSPFGSFPPPVAPDAKESFFLISTTHNGRHPAQGGGGQNSETQRAHTRKVCDHVSHEREAGFHMQHVACTRDRAPARPSSLIMLTVCARLPVGATARSAHVPLLHRKLHQIHPASTGRGSLKQRTNPSRPAQQPVPHPSSTELQPPSACPRQPRLIGSATKMLPPSSEAHLPHSNCLRRAGDPNSVGTGSATGSATLAMKYNMTGGRRLSKKAPEKRKRICRRCRKFPW